MTTIQPTDIALFLVSFAACVYCFVLSRRLKALQDTRDGLGATIMAMTKSVSAVSSATSDTRSQTNEIASRLSQLIAEAQTAITRISELTGTMEASHEQVSDEVARTNDELTGTLTKLLQEAEASTRELKFVLRQVRAHSSMTAQTQTRPAQTNPDALFEGETHASARKAG